MKRVSLLLLLLVLLGNQAMAIRHCNFKIKLIAPVTGDTVTPDNPFDIKARIYNLGPDVFQATDSAQFALYFNGSPILFYVDTVTSFPYLALQGRRFTVNDSADFGFTFTIDTGWKSGPTSVCVSFKPFAVSDIVDVDTTNNIDCARIGIYNPVGISTIARASNSLWVFPNPAHGAVNFSLHTDITANVALQIFDYTGRMVLQEDKGILSKGAHTVSVNTAQLPPGLYFYRTRIGDEQLNGTLQVQ